MSDKKNITVQWYQVVSLTLVTPAPVGVSWLLDLRNPHGESIQAIWIVQDLPKQTVPSVGDWGIFRLICYEMGMGVTVNFVTTLFAALGS